MTYPNISCDDLQKSAVCMQNDARTNRLIDTIVAQLGSAAVHFPRGPLVYFISNQTGLIKIGFSERVSARYGTLCSAAKTPLVLLGTVPGTLETERQYHVRFAYLRDNGEWFRETPELLFAIDNEAIKPRRHTWASLAPIYRRIKNRNRRPCDPKIFAETQIAFCLNLLSDGETEERLDMLEAAMDAARR